MKASRYNVIFPEGEYMVIFNTFGYNSILVEKTLAELLAKYTDNAHEIEKIHPDFYLTLLQGGFIVEDNYDEVEAVEQFRLKNLSDKTQYHLTVNPTLDCNFHCWYCYESKVKDSEMTPEMVNATIALIDDVLKENPNLQRFHLYFFGGEPLMKFDTVIRPILSAFTEKTSGKGILSTLQITTNGALLTNEMINFIKESNILTAFQITFDGYEENHNKSRFSKKHPDSYKLLINNVKTLVSQGFFVTLRVNYTHKNVEDLTKVLKEFEECPAVERNRIIYTPVRIWQDSPKKVIREACDNVQVDPVDSSTMLLANASVDYASSLGMQVMPVSSIDSVRYPCKHSYVNAASINYNGDVFKCCARAFNEENREGRLLPDGKIIWKEGVNERILRRRIEVNPPCKDCIIFPICGGGCVQSFKDFSNKEYCLYRFDEYSKIETVKRLARIQNGQI